MRKLLILVLAVCLFWVGSMATAHTVPDYVAVPADSEATLTLRPTHGCGTSPTIEVAVRVPVEGATPGTVSGWTASAEPDGSGNTVVTWSGGVLAADRAGAFPIVFTVPGTVGALMLFPAIQTCQNGEELAWISGDPASEYPAPRILVLAPGSNPAASIDDVPLDAPGRDQLFEIVDVDNPGATTTTTTAPTTTSTTPPTTTTTPAPTTTSTLPTQPGEAADPPAEAGGGIPFIAIGIGLVAVLGAAAILARRRNSGHSGPSPD